MVAHRHSTDLLLHHPLSASLLACHHELGQAVWTCRSHIADAGGYNLEPKPTHVPTHHSHAISTVYTWLRRRGMRPCAYSVALLDLEARRLFLADIVAERKGRAVIVLLYCTPRRKQGWDEMEAHAKEAAAVCLRTYLVDPVVVLLNLYGRTGRIQGRVFDTTL